MIVESAERTIAVRALYISPGHNYFGHHGQAAGEHPIEERREIRCVASRGIEGDRFFDYRPEYKGQITFFSWETYEFLCERLQIWDRTPVVFRRNVITAGLDLRECYGRTFELQGIRFEGIEESRPCYWMNEAFGEGAEELLKGSGGLRARILTDGTLRCMDRCGLRLL